jgi:plasmid maintenance system antidote protein VapI
MTKTDMAKALNISPKTYQFYVNGDRAIPSDKLLEMADLFGCTTDYLLGRNQQSTEAS